MSLLIQLLRQPAHALAGPAQRRLRIATGDWFHQLLQVANTAVSLAAIRLRPPPARRTCPRHAVLGFFSSARPWRITGREIPVARATAEIPPLSKARLSAAATKRRDRSSSNLLRAQKRFLIPPRSVSSPAYARTFLIGNVIS